METTRIIRVPKHAKMRIDRDMMVGIMRESYRRQTGLEPPPIEVRETKDYIVLTMRSQQSKKRGKADALAGDDPAHGEVRPSSSVTPVVSHGDTDDLFG